MVEVKPVRLQLSRRKGFNLQRLSRETNGLEAVNVARPSKWGNPYDWREWRDGFPRDILDWEGAAFRDLWCKEQSVDEFRELVGPQPENVVPLYMSTDDIRRGLAGKNLACWCAVGQPCHANVLLEIANPSPGREEHRDG